MFAALKLRSCDWFQASLKFDRLFQYCLVSEKVEVTMRTFKRHALKAVYTILKIELLILHSIFVFLLW